MPHLLIRAGRTDRASPLARPKSPFRREFRARFPAAEPSFPDGNRLSTCSWASILLSDVGSQQPYTRQFQLRILGQLTIDLSPCKARTLNCTYYSRNLPTISIGVAI